MSVRVVLPQHLRTLAAVDRETVVEVPPAATVGDLLDALEAAHPVLRGTIREHGTLRRRAYMRYFACGEDISHDPPTTPLPRPVASGDEVFRVLGAIAGG